MTRKELSNRIEAIEKATPIVDRIYASARGYQPANDYAIWPYSGRYGKGYLISYPNKEGLGGNKHSNRYYKIEYIIVEK